MGGCEAVMSVRLSVRLSAECLLSPGERAPVRAAQSHLRRQESGHPRTGGGQSGRGAGGGQGGGRGEGGQEGPQEGAGPGGGRRDGGRQEDQGPRLPQAAAQAGKQVLESARSATKVC